MFETLESRDLFTVTPVMDAEPLPQPQRAITADTTARSTAKPTAIIATNDLGPENVQKKHVANTFWPTPR